VLVAAAEIVTDVAEPTAVIVVPTGIVPPEIVRPMSPAPKASVADVTVKFEFVAPSVTTLGPVALKIVTDCAGVVYDVSMVAETATAPIAGSAANCGSAAIPISYL
jgi:hypothetical protein